MGDAHEPAHSLDVRGLLCPIPVTRARRAIADLEPGELLEIVGTDPVMVVDIPVWCDAEGHELVACSRDRGLVRCLVRAGADPPS